MTVEKKRRGVPPGILKEEPYFPDKVRKIVQMKDSGVRLVDIAKHFNMSSAGAQHLIKRWGKWARVNSNH